MHHIGDNGRFCYDKQSHAVLARLMNVFICDKLKLFPVVEEALIIKYYHFRSVSKRNIRWLKKHTTRCRLGVHKDRCLVGSSDYNANMQIDVIKSNQDKDGNS